MMLHLPDFTKAQVLVVGDVLLDRYWSGSASRISPEAPVPVVRVTEERVVPGGAGNVARNITSLGGRAILLALTGEDKEKTILEEHLTKDKVDCRFVTVAESTTITKLRVLSHHQQLLRLDFEEGFSAEAAHLLDKPLKEAFNQISWAIFSDYGKGTLKHMQTWLAWAKEQHVKTLVDPKGRDFQRYRQATLLTPNLTEFEAVVGECQDEAELVQKGQRLIDELQLEALLITRGEQGMTLLERAGNVMHLPTKAQEVFDVTGAGDTVIAVLGAALAAGSSLRDAVGMANVAAGIVVGKLGTATVSYKELLSAIHQEVPCERGVVDEKKLLSNMQEARARGEKIVMTNGCFDLLHAGHVQYLQKAKSFGDRLIVAVNDDASVARLKGQGRPLTPLANRLQVLAALAAVDWVVPFTEDTPKRLIEAVLPDVLVKGGDYEAKNIAGSDAVLAAGGEVRVVEFTPGCSTTAMIETIRGEST